MGVMLPDLTPPMYPPRRARIVSILMTRKCFITACATSQRRVREKLKSDCRKGSSGRSEVLWRLIVSADRISLGTVGVKGSASPAPRERASSMDPIMKALWVTAHVPSCSRTQSCGDCLGAQIVCLWHDVRLEIAFDRLRVCEIGS